jgi:hypothetical protein
MWGGPRKSNENEDVEPNFDQDYLRIKEQLEQAERALQQYEC